MAEPHVLSLNDDEHRLDVTTAGKIDSENMDAKCDSHINIPNGCIKHSTNDNGLIKVSDFATNCVKNELNVDNDNTIPDVPSMTMTSSLTSASTCDNVIINEPIVKQNNSQRNSTSDSGNYGSDADQIPNKCDVQYLEDAVDKCNLSNTDDHDDDIKEKVTSKPNPNDEENGIHYVVYESEQQMSSIMKLITKDLSEPYSIYTYRYFIHNWPKLCFLVCICSIFIVYTYINMHIRYNNFAFQAVCGTSCVGAIVCKLDLHKKMVRRGYIAMLAVDQNYRRRGIGKQRTFQYDICCSQMCLSVL